MTHAVFLEDDIEIFVEKLKTKIQNKFAKHKENIIPQFSKSVEDSLLVSHKKNIKNCQCKFFLGPVSAVKGLTSQVVYYLVIELDDTRDTKITEKKICVGCSKTNCKVRSFL